ncbi:MAG: ABC transporter permease [Candidatus Scalindua sp.]|nr:ABC transporter permease [Candidatus Scalindua sp.]
MDKRKNNTRITYSPDGPCVEGREGLFLKTRLMMSELVTARELVWRLFVRDFSAKYRQSLLGVIWAILMPFITVGMFVGMNRSGVLTIKDVGMPYPLYAIIGLTIWSLFTVGLTACTNSLVNAGAMVVKINFPKVALVLAASGQGVVEFFIRMVLIALTFLYYGVTPSWSGLFLGFICIIPCYLFMAGIGFVLSLVAGVMRDIVNVLSIVLMAFMLLTPILYPIKGDNMLARANVWNPFNYLVNVPRDLIVRGHTDFLMEFSLITLLSVTVFYMGWKLFYLAQTKIAERI